jgi:GNAT superfamily N-acetyltransferase
MERKWCTREYQPGDEDGIIALWKVAFPEGESERADLKYWNWQFRDNPAGFGRIRVAVAEDTIVGQYAIIPMRLQIEGEPVLATLSLDTMTHPDYRRQGMFTTLARELYAQLGHDGLSMTYGFPNENSLWGFTTKLQWAHICSLPVYVKPLRPSAIVERITSSHLLALAASPFVDLATKVVFPSGTMPDKARASVRWLERFDSRIDGLWQTVYDHRKIAVVRDATYLNWRYFLNPARDYRAVVFEEDDQIVACAVIRCMEQFGLRGGMITDIAAQPGRENTLQAVLTAVVQYSVNQEMDVAACLIYGDRRGARLLKRNGFFPIPRRAFKEWYFGVRVNNDSISLDMVNDHRNWYLTFGDTDVI